MQGVSAQAALAAGSGTGSGTTAEQAGPNRSFWLLSTRVDATLHLFVLMQLAILVARVSPGTAPHPSLSMGTVTWLPLIMSGSPAIWTPAGRLAPLLARLRTGNSGGTLPAAQDALAGCLEVCKRTRSLMPLIARGQLYDVSSDERK